MACGRRGGSTCRDPVCVADGGGATVTAPRTLPSLRVVPMTIGDARRFVEREHSHHHAPIGGLFACGVVAGDRLCCVAIVSRPVARKLDVQGTIAEITRLASDGTRHAASMCLAAATRGALALGWRRLVSYTIVGETGATYLAAGWRITGLVPPCEEGGWNSRAGRTVIQATAKARWETGPDALPANGAAALVVAFAAWLKLAVPSRTETLPLLRGIS